MALAIRRVVTGHDAQGRSVIAIDGVTDNIVSRRPGHSSSVIWTNTSTPADNASPMDGGLQDVAACAQQGAIFRVVSYDPGVAPRMHRTMTVDYAVVMSGEIFMVMDDGVEAHLKAGDVLVQRGTVHDWINRSDAPCVIAFVLIAAAPVEIAGDILGPKG